MAMAAKRSVVETMKGALRGKTSEELEALLDQGPTDAYDAERKTAVSELLEERGPQEAVREGADFAAASDAGGFPPAALRLRDDGYTADYGVARAIASFVSGVGWMVVVLGGFALGAALLSVMRSRYGGLSLMALGPGLGGVVSGLLLVMAGQMTRATADGADNTGRIVYMLKNRGVG